MHKQEYIKTDGDSCFNHIITLPQKDGNDRSLYDYQQIIFDSLVIQNNNKPVNFNKEHKAMLGHCKMILQNEGGRIAISPDKIDKLLLPLEPLLIITVF
jgi:hypothetical protein